MLSLPFKMRPPPNLAQQMLKRTSTDLVRCHSYRITKLHHLVPLSSLTCKVVLLGHIPKATSMHFTLWSYQKCLNHVHVQKRGFTKFSVFLKQVSSLNPRVRTNFVAFPIERTRKEPRSSVRFWAATGV